MNLADFTDASLVVPELQADEVAGVVAELAGVLERAGHVRDAKAFGQEVLRREAVASAAWGWQMAFPHAHIDGLSQPRFAFGRRVEPVAWGDRQVRSVFLIAVPADQTVPYLALISALARMNCDATLPHRLLAAGDRHDLLDIFRQIPTSASRLR